MIMQQMMMYRIMFGGYIPPSPPLFMTPPPPATPHYMPPPQLEQERSTTPSSMDVMVDVERTASPSSTASFSTYYQPSPPTSPHSLALDHVDQRSLSPSIFAGMHQNGQDMLWDYPRVLRAAESSSDESEVSDVDNGADVDDDVIFVREYERPYDVTPTADSVEHLSMRLLQAERSARIAEQRTSEVERILGER